MAKTKQIFLIVEGIEKIIPLQNFKAKFITHTLLILYILPKFDSFNKKKRIHYRKSVVQTNEILCYVIKENNCIVFNLIFVSWNVEYYFKLF